jgi:hypothetical protein
VQRPLNSSVRPQELMPSKLPLQLVGIFLAMCSCLVALPSILLAIINTFAVLFEGNLAFLHASGVVLFLVVAFHLFPLSLLNSRMHLQLFAVASIVLATVFGLLYYVAELRDTYRDSDGETLLYLTNKPFALAGLLCAFPLLRAGVRLRLVSSFPRAA